MQKSNTNKYCLWTVTDYGYEWAGGWLMAGEGRKQVLFGYLHTGTGGFNEKK